ncbi:MAG: Cna protein [Acidobacteriaceae bacterium]|nr:Cna protein [Acidobacteriaceae bacterium]
MKQLRPLSLLAPLLAVCTAGAWAQSTATLSGVVTDPTGAVVAGAEVKIHSLATASDREVVTDGSGIYAVPSLQPGDYSLQVTATGFSNYTVQKLTLAVDQRAAMNVSLALTSAGETIQVESGSGSAQIETQTMTVGQVIDRTTVQEIPLNGRHFLDLTVLTPGGVVAPTAGSLTGASRGLGANSFITAGNREDSVNFQINGINLNDMSQNQITFQPSVNTTSEFKIDNSTFSAEYGRSSGSIVNVSTRSGTNKFHGEAFDYFRNDALDARNYFNRNSIGGVPIVGLPGKKAPLKRNNFGAAFGGPIWRNKTFFFGSYEGLRQHQGVLQNSNVFTDTQRAAINATGKPTAKALLAVIPVANSGANYVAFTPGPVSIDQYTVDVLHQFRQQDSLHGFYAYQSDVRTEPALQGDTVPGFGDHRNAHRQIITLNETHIFSPNIVNEARLGANRITIAFNPNTLVNPASFGLGVGVNGNIGLPQTTISDLSLTFGGPATFPQGRADTYGVFSDAVTWLKGKHSIKFGGEFRRFLGASFNSDTGTLTYGNSTASGTTPAQTGSQNFANDLATGFNIQPVQISSRVYVNAAGLFLQDNFKITPRLTLEYGLRFEWNGTPTEGANRLVIFDPGTLSLIRTGTNGIGSVYKQNYNYEPRLGFAYDIFGTAKTVIRGGYGYMADQPVSGVVTGLASNPPFSTSVTYSNAAAPIPVSSLYSSAAASGIAINSVNPNFKNAYTQTFNLNLQHELPGRVVVSAGYYGSVGRHLRVRTNQNQPINGVRPYLKLSATSPISANAATNVNISQANSVSSSSYNALWLVATKSFSNGLSFNMNYNWSKSLDTSSLGSQGGYTLQDSYNPGNNWGPSDFDTRHHYAANAIYTLPFKGHRLTEGYSLSTIVQYQTGNPVNLTNTSTFTGVSGVIRPNLVGPIVTQKIQTNITNLSFIQSSVCSATLLPPNCSFQNTTNSLGNMSRNKIFGPGFADIDLSAQKETKIFESLTFKLRIDAFDILNHPNFGQPTGNTTSSSFGQITSTRFATSDGGSSRQLQISGKFLF